MPDQPHTVYHNDLGEGKLLKKHMSGYVWEVEFNNGQRYRLPAREFAQTESPDTNNGDQRPAPALPARRTPRVIPADKDQFTARQTIETLRFGVVPVQDVETLTIGLETERTALRRALDRAGESGDVLAVIGEYGYGKTHFVELAAAQALQKNFVVLTASMDLLETPPGKAHEIYRSLVGAVRYPDNPDDHSLRHLFKQALNNPAALREFATLAPRGADCPLVSTLVALRDSTSQRAYEEVIRWISGQKYSPEVLREALKKPPKLYITGETARQYTYLLSGLSVLATLCGYQGLAVMLDESELYSQVRKLQRERADQFFMALISAATGTNKNRIDPDRILNHIKAEYQTVFAPNPHLLFMFALTGTEDQMPVDSWLAPSQIAQLDDRFIDKDILEFMKMLLQYHQLAYGYKATRERYERFLTDAPKLISQALRDQRYNMREVIKAAVDGCDLLYLHPDYSPDDLLADLKHSLDG